MTKEGSTIFSETDEVAVAIARLLTYNFYKISSDLRNKLWLKLSEKDDTPNNVAVALVNNLLKLSEKDEAARDVARVVASNFDTLPENVRTELLLKLSEKDEAARDVARVVAENFDTLPENVRTELLIKLSEKDEAAWDVARVVAENFDTLPENVRNLLFKLSEKDEAAWDVARVVAENFDTLPENVRNLLFKLSEKDEAAWDVARVVASNFDTLPENVRNELLLKLSEKDDAAEAVARVVASNFDTLPENVRTELLIKLSEKDEAAWGVARVVAGNFDTLPENARNLLFKLSEKDKSAEAVVRVVAENFDKLPENVRNLLFKLSEKDEAAEAVARVVASNFDTLPENVRNELLFKLSEKDEAAEVVARVVAENFDTLPENVRNELLRKLSEKKRAGAYDFEHLANLVMSRRSWLSASRECIFSSAVVRTQVNVGREDEVKISSVTKFADIDFPANINLNQRYPLVVRLLTEQIDNITDDMILLFGYVEGIEEIEILITIDTKDFEIENSEQKMRVPLRKNSQPIVFYLTPKSTGKKKIHLKFYQDENYNGEIFIETTVYNQKKTKEESAKVVPHGDVGIHLKKEKSEDLLIEVELEDNGYLKYEVTSKKLGIFRIKYRTEERLHEPSRFINNILNELSEISSASYSNEEKYKNIISMIETVGEDLYKRLIPERLKQLLWDNKDRIDSIFIVTDQILIPWEIIKPFRITENGDKEKEDFWGMKYVIGRWLPGHFPLKCISVKKSAIIVNDYDGKLKCVTIEKENIENIFIQKGVEIIPIKPKRLEILNLFSDKTINLLHFACDSTYNERSPDDSYIKLSDYGLKARDIGVSNLKKGKPLVFLNACQSGRIDYVLSGVGGFSKAFLDAGAQAFIGTIWKIPDELSMKFSEDFYKNVFENGMSLGESLRETKRRLRTLRNPAWLSYSIYSFPLLRVI